jgi:2,3-bisphosphoglycerate-dependent phosphoglycerate mutase
MKQIYLIRHCKAEGQGVNAKLTEQGKQQAEELIEFFSNRNIELIVSSPFDRAVSTIRPFAENNNLKIHIEDRLGERVLSSDDIPNWMDRLKESFDNLDIKLQGGESSREAMNRGIAVIEGLLEGEESNIVVVTHGNLMSLILKYFDNRFGFDEWRGLTNPDIYELTSAERAGEVVINRLWK